MNEELFRERDRIIANVESYAAAEGLNDLGKLQAAVRFALIAGWNAGFNNGYDAVLVEKASKSSVDLRNNPYVHSLDKDSQ